MPGPHYGPPTAGPVIRANFKIKDRIVHACDANTNIIVSTNYKRRWAHIWTDPDNTDPVYVFLSESGAPALVSDPYKKMMPGDTWLLSMSGDEPWQGAIWEVGSGGDYVHCLECEDPDYVY